MLTYYCSRCKIDSAMTELDKPHCFYCGKGDKVKLIKKEKITPEVMAKRLKVVSDRMITNLKKAYFAGKKEDPDFDEDKLFEILEKADKLKKGIKKIFK